MQTVTSEDELLAIPQLMKFTAESESCWRKRLGRRELEFIRVGANVRVRRSELDRWIAARTVKREREQ